MAGSIFSLSFFVSLIASTIRLATPILIPALGQIYTQRAGILNLGVEGTMLMGAIAAFSTAAATGSLWLGILAGYFRYRAEYPCYRSCCVYLPCDFRDPRSAGSGGILQTDQFRFVVTNAGFGPDSLSA